MKKIALAAVAALTLSACATAPSPEQESAMLVDRDRPVTCSGAEDCEIKWGRAIQWVIDNNAYRIQVQTDSMIQTAGPLPNDPSLAVVVSKVPLGGGQQRFELRGGCDNMFGCSPSLDYAKAYFVRSVMDGRTGKQP